MDCLANKSSNVSISGRSGAEKLKAEAEEALKKTLDSNNNNKQVIVNIVINGASIFDVNHKGGETCEEEWGAQRVLPLQVLGAQALLP